MTRTLIYFSSGKIKKVFTKQLKERTKMFKTLQFKKTMVDYKYSASVDFGIQKGLYMISQGIDHTWLVLFNGDILGGIVTSLEEGIAVAQKHYENTCKKILDAIEYRDKISLL